MKLPVYLYSAPMYGINFSTYFILDIVNYNWYTVLIIPL